MKQRVNMNIEIKLFTLTRACANERNKNFTIDLKEL